MINDLTAAPSFVTWAILRSIGLFGATAPATFLCIYSNVQGNKDQ